ncbi:MAG: hypothetical protein Q7S58_08135, partial [Candidatus Binatus sp.]
LLSGGASTTRATETLVGGSRLRVARARVAGAEDRSVFLELTLRSAARYYDDIDESFVEAVFLGRDRISEGFRRKGRLPVLLEAANGLAVGCAVFVPKRGGAVKIGPLILREDVLEQSAVEPLFKLFDELRRDNHSWRRAYSLFPLSQSGLAVGFSDLGFSTEGLLVSPYKSGVDFVVKGKVFSGEQSHE